MSRLYLAAMLAAAAAAAQVGYPGQYPGSGPYPGSYPPGQYPQGTGPGIPMPGRHKKNKDAVEDLKQDNGKISEIAPDHLLVETTDHRNVSFALNKSTKYLDSNQKPLTFADFAVGATVMVESAEGDKEDFTAVNVHMVQKAPATVVTNAPPASHEDDDKGPPKVQRTPAPEPETPQTVVENAPRKTAAEADDGAPPALHRGKPRAGEEPKEEAPAEVASVERPPDPELQPDAAATAAPAPAAKTAGTDAFLDKAREVAEEFTEGLPNFTCSEMVTRYYTDSPSGVEWKPLDVIGTKLVYEGGKESYRDTTVGGKKADPQKSGAWSYGEFGTVLAQLFHVGAHFNWDHDSNINGFAAKKFNVQVERPHSNWTIHEGGQYIRPAYKGSVWIDKASYRVVRIEQQAVEVPKEFPADTAEMALDYQFVSLGSKKFLVPVHAEVLMCHRGTPECERNVIDFRNYRKFGSETDITFGQ